MENWMRVSGSKLHVSSARLKNGLIGFIFQALTVIVHGDTDHLHPALLCALWYCGSLCAAGLWRYILDGLTCSGRFMTCPTYVKVFLPYSDVSKVFRGYLIISCSRYLVSNSVQIENCH